MGNKYKRKAFMHFCFLVTWTPLVWVMSGDLIESYVIGWKYKHLFMWGCGSSTALFNIYHLFRNAWLASDNDSRTNLFIEAFGRHGDSE